MDGIDGIDGTDGLGSNLLRRAWIPCAGVRVRVRVTKGRWQSPSSSSSPIYASWKCISSGMLGSNGNSSICSSSTVINGGRRSSYESSSSTMRGTPIPSPRPGRGASGDGWAREDTPEEVPLGTDCIVGRAGLDILPGISDEWWLGVDENWRVCDVWGACTRRTSRCPSVWSCIPRAADKWGGGRQPPSTAAIHIHIRIPTDRRWAINWPSGGMETAPKGDVSRVVLPSSLEIMRSGFSSAFMVLFSDSTLR